MYTTMIGNYTAKTDFFKMTTPFELLSEYGSPLYVYNEDIFRSRLRQIKNLVKYKNFVPHYSVKANTNISLLKIVKEEGLHVDTMSPGEIYMALAAGFEPKELFYIPNNATEEDLRYAVDRGVLLSVDSISQLQLYAKINPNSKVAIRFNPGVGAGHHQKVVTAGKKTKFGVDMAEFDTVKKILEENNVTLVGINQHIGSLFMDSGAFIESTTNLLEFAKEFDSLEFIDLGGGFGIPYHKQEDQQPLDLVELGSKMDTMFEEFAQDYGREIQFQIEPGRIIACEAGIVLGTVTGTKQNAETTYLGCDIGFNVLARPIMYDSHHDIELYTKRAHPDLEKHPVTVVGNICESGDILAKDRELPMPEYGDIIGLMDAGAYGFAMSSSYNQRPRVAEVLLKSSGEVVLIRRRETFEDLIASML
ncbi:diaminopimelate decarboxylase [Candidatus Epulonipiscium viviparus]|uniref:diaminopimelate decarboxylase n=1 Tax=Candidatus Epulonipiscium viviparus TaxID=420336 RepID=UPI002ED38338